MPCSDCQNWIVSKQRLYDDGSKVIYFQVTGGRGLCEKLYTETDPDFSCNKYTAAPGFDHIGADRIAGSPWQNFNMGACPDCKGRGCGEGEIASACFRCAGTGHVRFYDDGYIGEERTRRHPKEPETPEIIDPGTVLAEIPKASVL